MWLTIAPMEMIPATALGRPLHPAAERHVIISPPAVQFLEASVDVNGRETRLITQPLINM